MIEVKLSLPPSVNRLYKTIPSGKRALTREGRVYKNSVAWKTCNLEKFGDAKVFLFCKFYIFDLRKHDSSNMLKILEDSFKYAGLIDDDNQIYESWQTKVVEKKTKTPNYVKCVLGRIDLLNTNPSRHPSSFF